MRDYHVEMRAVIDKAVKDGGYVPRQLATKIVMGLRETDPELLEGWLQEQAEHFVWQAINDRDRAVRAHVRHTNMRGAFAAAAERHEAGEEDALQDFLGMRFTVADGTRRCLGDLFSPDLRFIADYYGKRKRQNAMMEHLILAIDKRVGDRNVKSVFTNEQMKKMFESLGVDFPDDDE